MSFDATHVPETVDFVIVHYIIGDFIKGLNDSYEKLADEVGIGIEFRAVEEYDVYNSDRSTLNSFTGDSVVFLHGRGGIAGVRTAKAIGGDGRFIVTADLGTLAGAGDQYEVMWKVIQKELGVEDNGTSLSPEVQLSVYDTTIDPFYEELYKANMRIKQYIVDLGELRGKQ